MWNASGTVALSDGHTADGGMTMMNDAEFRKFLNALRSAYGLPPVAASDDTGAYEDFIAEDDYTSQSPFSERV
jgi:hypothetical protein